MADDLHGLLYLRNEPEVKSNPSPWVKDILTHARELPEFHNLRVRCQGQGLASGVATEAMLEAINDLIPDTGNEQGTPGDQDGTDPGDPTGGGSQRRRLRQAVRRATEAVDQAEAALEGLLEPLGLTHGTQPGHPETLQDLDDVRGLYAALKQSRSLAEIARLAGRLSRLGAGHKRCQVTPAVGGITGVTTGTDLERVLPGELVGLRSPVRVKRLHTLHTLITRQALGYQMRGVVHEERGPCVVCVDESSSMRGEADTWAKAVALALLQTVTEQRRAWHFIGFNAEITYEATIAPGDASMETLTKVLLRGVSGGTEFTPPLSKACDLISSSPVLRKADIVLITDGDGGLFPSTMDRVNTLRQQEGMHVYLIAIGSGAETRVLAPIADAIYRVSESPERDSGVVAPVIALEL